MPLLRLTSFSPHTCSTHTVAAHRAPGPHGHFTLCRVTILGASEEVLRWWCSLMGTFAAIEVIRGSYPVLLDSSWSVAGDVAGDPCRRHVTQPLAPLPMTVSRRQAL